VKNTNEDVYEKLRPNLFEKISKVNILKLEAFAACVVLNPKELTWTGQVKIVDKLKG